jgi:hypothetical protein
MRTPQDLDERTLAMHMLVAEKLRRDPQLLQRVDNTLQRWRAQVCERSQPYLVEWQKLVDQGVDACVGAMTERTQRAAAMRQASPFAAVLSNQERFEFLRRWRAMHAAS